MAAPTASGRAVNRAVVIAAVLALASMRARAGDPLPGAPPAPTFWTADELKLIDRGLEVGDAVAAPRLSSRNGTEEAETPIFATAIGDELRAKGHVLRSRPVIGNATAIRSLSPDLWTAAAEPTRRGGGSAMVVDPR